MAHLLKWNMRFAGEERVENGRPIRVTTRTW